MNRINPLYLGAFLIIILMFVSFKLFSAEESYQETKDSYKQTLQLAQELSSLKVVYANKKQTKKSILKILRHSVLKSAEITQVMKKTNIQISSKSMDIKSINFLMGKLLNGTYQINSLKIKQLSEIRVSLDLEIKW